MSSSPTLRIRRTPNQRSSRMREQEFRSRVEKLFQLTSALHEELKATPTTDVLPVKSTNLCRKNEKLARPLESKLKG